MKDNWARDGVIAIACSGGSIGGWGLFRGAQDEVWARVCCS